MPMTRPTMFCGQSSTMTKSPAPMPAVCVGLSGKGVRATCHRWAASNTLGGHLCGGRRREALLTALCPNANSDD